MNTARRLAALAVMAGLLALTGCGTDEAGGASGGPISGGCPQVSAEVDPGGVASPTTSPPVVRLSFFGPMGPFPFNITSAVVLEDGVVIALAPREATYRAGRLDAAVMGALRACIDGRGFLGLEERYDTSCASIADAAYDNIEVRRADGGTKTVSVAALSTLDQMGMTDRVEDCFPAPLVELRRTLAGLRDRVGQAGEVWSAPQVEVVADIGATTSGQPPIAWPDVPVPATRSFVLEGDDAARWFDAVASRAQPPNMSDAGHAYGEARATMPDGRPAQVLWRALLPGDEPSNLPTVTR